MIRCLLVALLGSVLAVDALRGSPGFHVQEYDYYPEQWETQPGFGAAVDDGDVLRDTPHDPGDNPPENFPGHRPPKTTNSTIFTFLSEEPEFSRVFKVVNISDEIVSVLNDTSTNVTFFAVPNSAIPKKPPHRRHRHHLGSRSLLEDLTLVDLISALETAENEGSGLAEDLDEERFKKIVTAILSYHIVNDKLGAHELAENTTYATRLSHVFGALKDEPLRLRFGAGFPFARVNYYSQVIIPDISAANGFIHGINRPLLPPPSAFQTLFLLQQQFSIFTSAVQRTGITNVIDYRFVPASGDGSASLEGSPVVTAFVPSNNAFSRLPRKLQFFLFSPFGERALKKLLQYHTVPDIALFTDWVLNVTSGAVLDQGGFFDNGMGHLDSLHHAYDYYYDVPIPFQLSRPSGPGICPDRSHLGPHCSGGICFDRSIRVDNLQAPERDPSNPPCCKDFLRKCNWVWVSQEGGEGWVCHGDGHPPTQGLPLPKPEIVGNYTLPTALEDHSLNVLVVKIPIRLPFPKKGKVVGHIKRVVVNGKPTSSYDGVALNGALHVVDKLISPHRGRKRPDHEGQMHFMEFESDEWEDWEEWLPAWAED